MITKFTTETKARNFIYNASEMLFIVLGDDNKFWIVTPAAAARMEKAGYEILPFGMN